MEVLQGNSPASTSEVPALINSWSGPSNLVFRPQMEKSVKDKLLPGYNAAICSSTVCQRLWPS